ncbi:MAG TPA: hypothetical protein PK335_14930, partial [Draconibacterium sp.]|nr:hypothetical protein [Draconibacterium sp.]
PATQKKDRNRILDLTQLFYNPNINKDSLHAGWFYIDGNVVTESQKISSDNWDGGIQGKGVDKEAMKKSRLDKPIDFIPVETSDAVTAYEQVLQNAGANFFRDAVDQRVLEEVRSGIETLGATYDGGGKGIIDSQNEVGGWPELKSKLEPADSDNDGMPDRWEKDHGLNPGQADNNEYSLDKNYTNLEVYINSLVQSNL